MRPDDATLHLLGPERWTSCSVSVSWDDKTIKPAAVEDDAMALPDSSCMASDGKNNALVPCVINLEKTIKADSDILLPEAHDKKYFRIKYDRRGVSVYLGMTKAGWIM
jgi:hypothetical protein